MASASYAPRPIAGARSRRSRAEIDHIKDRIVALLRAERPMTCRQMFYRLVSDGRVGKTETEYKGTVVRLLGELRQEGAVPYHWIADSTRWMRKPDSYGSLQDALRNCRDSYRRALWLDQDAYVEVWCEKDALAGIIAEVTAPWDVPLMIARGFASLSYLHSAAEAIAARRKPAFIYYFGDLDPSGLEIGRQVERRLREFAPTSEIRFARVAITPNQIEEFRLPTRPTKAGDSRSRTFKGESVDLDALPPAALRSLVAQVIEPHIDPAVLNQTRLVEREEQILLDAMVAQGFSGGAAHA